VMTVSIILLTVEGYVPYQSTLTFHVFFTRIRAHKKINRKGAQNLIIFKRSLTKKNMGDQPE